MSVSTLPRRQRFNSIEMDYERNAMVAFFALPPTRAEVINTFRTLRQLIPADITPPGWEPSDKSNASDWEDQPHD